MATSVVRIIADNSDDGTGTKLSHPVPSSFLITSNHRRVAPSGGTSLSEAKGVATLAKPPLPLARASGGTSLSEAKGVATLANTPLPLARASGGTSLSEAKGVATLAKTPATRCTRPASNYLQ